MSFDISFLFYELIKNRQSFFQALVLADQSLVRLEIDRVALYKTAANVGLLCF